MELRRYLHLIRQRTFLIVLTLLVGMAIGWAVTLRHPTYTASATIYVGSRNFEANNEELFAEQGLDQVVDSFAAMIPDPVIAQKAIGISHVDEFAGAVAANTVASVVPNTSLITVSVTDPDPLNAIRLTNGVADAFVAQVSKYQTGTTKATTGTAPTEPAYVFQDAGSAAENSTGLIKRLILGGIFGFIVAVFLILLLDYLDITVKSPEELERRIGLPVLGVIPYFALQLDTSPSHVPVGARHA